jgi:aminomethyltransferase
VSDRTPQPIPEAETVTVLGFPTPLRCSTQDAKRLETAGLLAAPWERSLVVTGRDAARFLHNLLTQDVNGMPISSVRPSALADRKGHALAEAWLWREEESRFVLRASAPYLPVLLDVLERHRIMERVEWTVRPDPPAAFLVVGPNAGAVVGADPSGRSIQSATVDRPPEGGRLPVFGEDAFWMRVSEISPHDRVVFAPAAASDSLAAALGSASPVGWEAFDRARIQAGRAWMGLDVDAERLVPEPGWDDHISYAKGCYLGQETLARLHYQGRLNWRLVRFTWPGAGVPHGTEVRDSAGGRAGWLTSVGDDAGRCFALGYLHRRIEEDSLPVALADGRPAAWEPLAS